MIPYVVYLLCLPGVLPGLFYQPCEAAPASYDQRQTGEFNFDAKLENFLVVYTTSGNFNILDTLAAQAFELRRLSPQAKASKQEAEEPSAESVIYETEEHRGREPYHVEIVRIEKEGDTSARSSNAERSKGENKERGSTDPSKSSVAGKRLEEKKEEKKKRSLWRYEEDSEDEKRVSESFGEDAKGFPVREESLKPARPGISLKKQLSRKENVVPVDSDGERNDVGSNSSSSSSSSSSAEVKPEELKLLGDGIENCGPGRYRDKTGVCQFDKNFH